MSLGIDTERFLDEIEASDIPAAIERLARRGSSGCEVREEWSITGNTETRWLDTSVMRGFAVKAKAAGKGVVRLVITIPSEPVPTTEETT